MKNNYFLFIFLIQLILFSIIYSQDFEIPIKVSDGTFSDTLVIGVNPDGTDGYDDTLDILAPPLPPSGAFGTLLEWNYEQYYKDIRDNSTTEKTFQLHYQESSGGAIVLNWDSTGLSQLGTFIIQDRFDGSYFSLDMTTTNTLDVYSYSILNDWLKIKVTPSAVSTTVSDSTTITSGDPPPVQIGSTDVTVDFSECPGGEVHVDQYEMMPLNLSGNAIEKMWDIYADMPNFTFMMDLRIDYNDDDIAGLNENMLTIAFLDTVDSIWFKLDSTRVFPDQNYIMAYNVNHMTDFAVGEEQIFNDLKCYASVRTFMDGAYSSGSLSTDLNDQGLIPLSQPYSVSPWNYNGTENVAAIPTGVVDWVLVQLRYDTDSSNTIVTKAAFLKSDGSIVALDGVSSLDFETVIPGNYYVVIHHRNHISIMGNYFHLLRQSPVLFDFTTGINMFYNSSGAKEIDTNVWGMWSGDINRDGEITTSDYTLWYNSARSGNSGYVDSDINGDGQVTTSDYTIWYNTARSGASSSVPK
jgi:hypothetical protein